MDELVDMSIGMLWELRVQLASGIHFELSDVSLSSPSQYEHLQFRLSAYFMLHATNYSRPYNWKWKHAGIYSTLA